MENVVGRAGIEDRIYTDLVHNDIVTLGWGRLLFELTGCNEFQSIKHKKLTKFDYPINQLDTASCLC